MYPQWGSADEKMGKKGRLETKRRKGGGRIKRRVSTSKTWEGGKRADEGRTGKKPGRKNKKKRVDAG